MTDAQDIADQMQALHERITRLIETCRAEADSLPWTFDEPEAEQLQLFDNTRGAQRRGA